jgi:putative NADH-flavin reductase
VRISVLGATGRTGRQIVEQALQAGHEVVAFARKPEALEMDHERLTVVQGDILDAERVSEAVGGAEAVISALGAQRDSPEAMLTRGMANVVAAMKEHGVRRLIALTGAGVRLESDPASLGRTIVLALQGLFSPSPLRDAQGAVEVIRASGLDWTVVRVTRLSDRPGTGRVHGGAPRLEPIRSIPRADVARFVLEQVTDERYLVQAPMVAPAPR